MLDGGQWYGEKKKQEGRIRIVEGRERTILNLKGLPERVTFEKDLKEVREWAMNLSGEENPRQRE